MKVQEQKVKCPNCEIEENIGDVIGVSSTDEALYICPSCRYAEIIEDGKVTNIGIRPLKDLFKQ